MQNGGAHPVPLHDPMFEQEIREAGESLFALMDTHPEPGIFSRKGAYARLMEWALKDEDFKARLFRFVDVLPTLHDPKEVLRHLHEYLGSREQELGMALRAGLATTTLAPTVASSVIRSQVQAMARQFVAGETTAELVARVKANAKAGMATTVDLLGEAVLTDPEADVFLERNLAVLAALTEGLDESEPCASDLGTHGRALPRVNLSVKLSALSPNVNPGAPEHSIEQMKVRMRPLLRAAAKLDAFVTFDMESMRMKDLTLAFAQSILGEAEFRGKPMVGIVLQAYLKSAEADMKRMLEWAGAHGRVLGVRLVKGAYWDSETILAAQRNWPVPVWTRKEETDATFERMAEHLLKTGERVIPAFATHNVRSCACVMALARRMGLEKRALEFQLLYGMGDDLKHALLKQGWRVREYCAIGDLLPSMSYLVRRLLENTSNESFLRRRAEGTARAALLESPAARLREPVQENRQGEEDAKARECTANQGLASFKNAANTDFTQAGKRSAMEEALRHWRETPPREYASMIAGYRETGAQTQASTNPAKPGSAVGVIKLADAHGVEAALGAARQAQGPWARSATEVRCRVLERTAELLEAHRAELGALLVLEAGKPWPEADAEVSEAIDFCTFYAADMRTHSGLLTTLKIPGEDCAEEWRPLGTGVVIAPWNFPLAILGGMTVAALVTGNTVVLKPSQLTPVIATRFVELMREAGLPEGALSLVLGEGRTLGAKLAAAAQTRFVAFTGSREVGCALWEMAGRTPAGQGHLKRMICEMGGKNALIIDADADLDEAIPAIIQSAFSYAGQKCSALSRLIVHEAVHDALVARLTEACRALQIGDPADPATLVGPVIDAAAKTRLLRLIEEAKTEASLHWQAKLPTQLAEAGGHYVPPTLFTGVQATHRLAREELFGPVLAIMKAHSIEHALQLANDSDYALTGGVFSRSPSTIEQVRSDFNVGNLYINRGITGAIVGRHPFGGDRMSGGGTKAGGLGYIEHFMVRRCSAENTLRKGFAPKAAG